MYSLPGLTPFLWFFFLDTPVPSIKITSASGRSKRLSVERKKRINKLRRLSAQKEKAKINSNETFTADYGQFQVGKIDFNNFT